MHLPFRMPIKFPCHSCGQVLSVGSNKVGRRAKCPKCRERIVVPDREDAADQMLQRQQQPHEQQETEDPYSQFVVYDDETEFVYESEEKPAEEENTVDRDLVAVPRLVLYMQGILLAVVALVCFALGIMVGGLNPGDSTAREPRPCRISGTIAYSGTGSREIPDDGAVVIVLPKDRRPDQRSGVAGLLPDDPFPPDGHESLRMLREIDGVYTRTDEQGNFQARVPDVGDYYILVVSAAADRGPSEDVDNRDVEQLGRYFHPAYELLGNKKYDWESYRIKSDLPLKVVFN